MTDNSSSSAVPRVGIAPDSWGVWNAVDVLQPGPDQYLREVAEAGYTWTEIGPFGYLGTDHQQVADDIASHGLKVSGGTVFTGMHRGLAELDKAWPEISKVAAMVKSLGAEHLITIPEMWQRHSVTGDVESARTFTTEEWTNFFAGHDALGKRLLEEFGLRQQFHSHAETPVGSYNEIVRLLEGTNPKYTNLCLDTGHFSYYWGDSVRLIKEYPNRVGYLHLKQVHEDILADVLKNEISFVDAVQMGIMVEPPQGSPDYGPILEEANKHNPGIFAIIEQDMYPLPDFALPKQIAIRTREYIEGLSVPTQFN